MFNLCENIIAYLLLSHSSSIKMPASFLLHRKSCTSQMKEVSLKNMGEKSNIVVGGGGWRGNMKGKSHKTAVCGQQIKRYVRKNVYNGGAQTAY